MRLGVPILGIYSLDIQRTMEKNIVVLIHGFGFDSRIWSPVELAFNSFKMVSLSLPGFGVKLVSESYRINDLAQKFWMHPDLRGDHQVHLVGHSMGGYVCMEMIAQQPSRIASLVLVHSHVFADAEAKKQGRTAILEDIKLNGRQGLVNKMIPSLFGNKEGFEEIIAVLLSRGMAYNDDAWYYGLEAIRDRQDHSETLRNIHAPVLMIMGKKDMAVPIELAYQQASIPEQNKLCLYPEVGHMAMYEKTGQMIADLFSFWS